jgi:hypothetical protein
MKKTSIFAVASTFILLVAGIFASKAARKFAGATTVYYKGTGITSPFPIAFKAPSTDNLVTASVTGNGTAYFYVGTSTRYTLCTTGGTALNALF